MSQHVAAVVLAGGRGQRFGGDKLTARLHGRPIVAYPVRAALDAGVDEVVVVGREGLSRVLPGDERVRIVAADGPDQSDSLRAGIRALGPEVAVAVVLLGDQPLVDTDLVRRVASAAVAGGVDAVRVAYLDGPGHPVAFARSAWPALCEVEGDRGARDLLQQLVVRTVEAAVEAPRDVDTPTDLDRLRSR